MKTFLLSGFRYFGFFNKNISPLLDQNKSNGRKWSDEQQEARQQIRESVAHLSIQQIDSISDSEEPLPKNLQFYGLSEKDVKNALAEHSHYLRRNSDDVQLYFRRRVLLGIGVIALGVWLPTIKSCNMQSGSSRYSNRGNGRY